MATKETETPPRHNEDGLPIYPTRYGMRTAKEAANELFEKSHARLQFLENVFAAIQFDDCLHLKGCANHGLAAVLEDISVDIDTFHAYLIGEDPAPGKLAEGRPP